MYNAMKNLTNKEEIHKEVEMLSAQLRYLKERFHQVSDQIEQYYYKISLCNSSDSFNKWKATNPNHEHMDKFKVQRPINSGWLSDVGLRILKCDITREDFIALAKEVVSPSVGNDDFNYFDHIYPQ